MTAPGRYAASDGSFAKSAGGAAARGGVLIVIALVIGFALLQWGFDGGDSDAALPGGDGDGSADDGGTDDGSTDDGTADDGTTDDGSTDEATDDGGTDGTGTDDGTTDDGTTDDTASDDAVSIDPPSDVIVAVLNGSGVGGLAAERGGVLGVVGYVWTAGNAATFEVSDSRVYFTEGYADEAKQVAEALSGTAAVLEQAPADPTTLASESSAADVAAADIIVVLGTDEQLR
ncbi:MAG: LytR C-terminal domain-containing protein [Acidimicrobiales bacterium]|nr:LytR C-terminal domain-containing protein [Acidimicrobiales bacterium]